MQPGYTLHESAKTFLKALLYLMVLMYLVNCFTPLHLHFDSVRYYNIKDCIEGHCPDGPVGVFASTDYLPYGYTALLIVLSKLGILKSFSIVLINCIYVFGGLLLVRKIFEQQVHPLLLGIVALLNWTIIKFATHPLSEMQYIFFSSVSLYCFHMYIKRKSYLQLAIAFLFAFLTILTRAVGISLVAALFAGILWQYRSDIVRIIKKNKLVLVILAIAFVIVVFFARQLKIIDYTVLLKEPLQQGIGNFILTNLKFHFTEMTEIFLNVPYNKVQRYVPNQVAAAFFIMAGVLFFAWLMYNTFSRRSRVPFYIKIYLLFYALIIMNWPYYDPRFWVPVLPLITGIILQTPFNATSLTKTISRLYLAGYIILGLVAAGYGLYVGLDKERFAKNHAKGDYRNEYELHFFGKPQSDTAHRVDQNVVDILNKYD